MWRLVSPLAFLEGQRCGSVGGAGFAVVACVFSSQSSAVCPPLLGDACLSQSVVGSALMEVFGFFLRKGAVRPVSSSVFFFSPAVWSSPRRQFSGVCFSFSSWKLLLDRSFSLLGLLRRFILRFVLRSVCLSLVMRVLFRSILLLVLVCLRLRTGSFAR